MNVTGTATARHLPGESGIWLFIFGDMLVFSLLFATFLYYRADNVALFNTSQAQLSQFFGALNTLFMLTSSWFVATAVQASRRGAGRLTPMGFLLAFLCGVGFVVNKYFEWGAKIRAGHTLNSSEYYMYYYLLTGIHLMHVLIGMAVLAVMARYTWAGGPYDARTIRNLESGGSFWHVVDLLWIVLFALLYLVR